MNQSTSYIFASGYLALLLSVLVGVVSFLAPFWIRNGQHGYGEGLWARCNPTMTECVWFNDDEFSNTPDWLKACQGLFASGVTILLVIYMTATCHVCCRCGREWQYLMATVIGWITIVGFASLSVSISVFGIMNSHEKNVAIDIYLPTDSKFDWGYYAAIACSGSSLVAATLFICEGNRATPHYSQNQTELAMDIGLAKMV